ncbi:MAG: hypothetical protein QM811_26150 [Pirellulales bacterium]
MLLGDLNDQFDLDRPAGRQRGRAERDPAPMPASGPKTSPSSSLQPLITAGC